jgi:signal transduction histidine kinase
MNHASRCALATCALLASALPVAATLTGLWAGSPPLLAVAVAGLAVAGLLFHNLLMRHLGAADHARQLRLRWQEEQGARSAAEGSLADVHAALCSLIRQQEQVRDSERQRIARDIHDDLGQHLLALKIEVQLARHGSDKDGAPLERLSASIEHSITALRTVIDNLRPIQLQDGLAVALVHHLRECARVNGINCRLQAGSEEALSGIDPDSEVMLLRIVREAVANVLRHARAGSIVLAARRGDGKVTVEVADDGIGMGMEIDVVGADGKFGKASDGNHGNHGKTGGCGLAGIAERIAAVGGQFAIASGPERGTVLTFTVPLPRR